MKNKNKLTPPVHSKISKNKSSKRSFSFEKTKKEDTFEGISLGVNIVNMGIQGSKLGFNSYRKFTTGIYFKQDYVFYTNGHFLVYRKLLKTDIEDTKTVDGQLWEFTHHKKPKANMPVPYVFYKIRKIDKDHSEAVSDYGFVKISNDIIFPTVPFPNINEKNFHKNYISTGINIHYLEIIASMIGSKNYIQILINKRYNKDALLITDENAGALLMPIDTNTVKQINKHNQLKNDIEKILKKKGTKE